MPPIDEETARLREELGQLVDKIKSSEGADLKRLLFSLKTSFQSDRNLVYEFVSCGGLEELVSVNQSFKHDFD